MTPTKHAHNWIDRTGVRYGKLIAVSDHGSYWLCECDCGNTIEVLSTNLAQYARRNLGCQSCPRPNERKAHYDNWYTYNSWSSMIQRCTNPNNNRYHRYGGRGITVCERWLNFDNFFADMGKRPDGYTIGRINGDGNYEPSNCRWETYAENYRDDYKQRGR